jgi:hypothetical protein
VFSGKSIGPLSLLSSLLVIALTLTTVGSTQTSKDSNEVSGFLSDVKTGASSHSAVHRVCGCEL